MRYTDRTMKFNLASSVLLLGSALITANGQSVSSSAGTELAENFIVTQTDVSNTARLILDLSEIQEYIQLNINANFTGNAIDQADFSDDVLKIYTEGLNAIRYDEAGNDAGGRISLASLSTQASTNPAKNPLSNQAFYNLHLYGLTNRRPIQNHLFATFGDEHVKTYIDQFFEVDPDLVPDSILALVIYPYMISRAYEVLDDCDKFANSVSMQSLAEADYQNYLSDTNKAIDEMIALYVGAEQTRASSDGFSFYALAQRAAAYFDTDLSTGDTMDFEGDAPVNQKIRELYEEVTKLMSFGDACHPGSKTTGQLHSVIQRMVSQTQITLTQMLIHSIVQKDEQRTKIYSLALIPQTVRCRPSNFDTLYKTFLDTDVIEFGEGPLSMGLSNPLSYAIIALQASYSCLGFTCDDIGIYQYGDATVGKCADRPALMPMAGYSPVSDVYNVRLPCF